MPLRLVPLLAAVCLLASTAGCLTRMTDELEESREEARARDAEKRGPGEESTAPTPDEAARTGPWPWPGSHVRYRLQGGEGDAAERESWSSEVRLTYDGHQWTGTCEGTRTERKADGTTETRRFAGSGVFAPLLGPAGVTRGQAVTVEVLAECRVETTDLIVQGLYPEDTVHDGEPTRTRAWWADEGPSQESERDDDAWWDEGTLLLLRWELSKFDGDRGTSGKLVDTDAPLG